MLELLYTILELEEWNRRATCDFCPGLNKAVCQIRTRSKLTDKIVANACTCEECKEKFENDELPKCSNCGRLETKDNFFHGKHVCDCIRNKEDTEEKELPILPIERRQTAFYERQINALQEEKSHLTTEAQSHLDAMEVFEVYNKKHRQELLDRIKELEAENKRLKDSTPQELLNEISKLKERVKELEQQTAQIEIKPNKKSFLFFGKKS